MSPPRQKSGPSSSAENFTRILSNDSCPLCERMLDELNRTFSSVHHFVLANYANRAVNDDYLGELGRLIHRQVVARRMLIDHQRSHSAADAEPIQPSRGTLIA